MKGIFAWFKNNTRMKRWMLLILIGVVFVSFGIASIMTSTEAITFIDAAKIIVFFVIGFTFIVLGMVFLNKRTMEVLIEATDDRIQGKRKVNLNSLIFNKTIYDKGPKIVIIGGGSGLNTLLEGLKKYTNNITAIVTVSTYGETLAKDNERMKYLQLEDIKNGIAALSRHDTSKMSELLNYRFQGGALKGIAFSDIYFEAISDISNGLAEAVKNSNEIFKIYGEVLPVTEDKMKICAELGNGYVVEEKSQIASMVYDKLTKINRVYLSPSNCKPTPGVIDAIKKADCIIMGPGSLYANVIPNLLVNGVSKAIKESKAKKVYVCNIMTEPGLTDNYSVGDHVNSIIEHCGNGLIDYCLYDTGEIVPEVIKRYNKDGSDLVEQDISKVVDKKIKFLKENLSVISDNCIRHNATFIADIVIQMICDDMKFMDKQNEPEYLMLSTKLKADKEIKKSKMKSLKTKRHKPKGARMKGKTSKFVSKYSSRIESIKNTDSNAEIRKQNADSKSKGKRAKNSKDEKKKIEAKKIDENKKNEERKIEQERKAAEQAEIERVKSKSYEEIRREILGKLNNDKMRK